MWQPDRLSFFVNQILSSVTNNYKYPPPQALEDFYLWEPHRVCRLRVRLHAHPFCRILVIYAFICYRIEVSGYKLISSLFTISSNEVVLAA